MNYAGTFDFSNVGDALTETTVGAGPVGDISSSAGSASTIIVDDAHLLFSGDYKRSGIDLVLSKDGHEHVVSDYFKGTHRATLSSPDGATLSADLVKALVGEVQVAQLGGGANAAAQEIGTVTKLTGSATAIRNGVSVMLNAGDKVQKGDIVQAGADSSLGLTFIDGTVFGLSANARMVLNEMVYDPNGSSNSSLLSLVQGTITFVAGETAKHGDMRVDTPVATMGIRGTAVLVEIGFEVPGQGGAPPVKFQVLVEPGGRTGSYVLYSKTTGQIIGTVDQAGLVTSVTGLGDTSTTPADPLTSIAQGIIQQTLQQYFPNYVPNANPRSNGSGSGSTPADPNSGTSPDPLKFAPPPDVPTGVPFTVPINLPGNPPDTPPINVTIFRFNTAPTIVVAPVVVTLPVNKTSFDIKDQVQITDPDSGDVAIPYVPGTAHIITATGPSNAPAGLDLKTLITVDPQTGHVSYNPAAFKFLGEGQTAVYTIGFDSQSGPDTVHETITFTVDGANDAPEVAALLTSAAPQGAATQSINLLTGATDPDSGETATLSVTHVRYAVDGGAPSATAPTGFSLTRSTLHVDPANPVFAHLAQGQTMTIVVSYDVIDIHGASVTQTETVTITGTNDAPVIDLNGACAGVDATAVIAPDGQAHALFSNVAISDVDDGATIHCIKITWTGRGNDILTLGDCNPNIHVQYVNGGIILSGNASAGEYQAFLEAMTLELLGPETPSFTVVVNDGITDSAPATVTVAPPASWNFWTGNANDGNWNSPGNWTLGHVPTASETAYVSSTTPISFNLGAALALAGLIVIAGTELDLTGTGSLNITGTLVNDGTILLAPTTTFEVNGVVQNQGQLIVDNHAAGSTLLIHDHVTFTGGGTITLDGTADRITGDTFQSTLTNADNKIDGYGKIGDGQLTLVNGVAGIIAATDFWHGITINTGQGTFTNDGLVVSASLFGGLEITGAVVNYGTLEAHLGLLKIDGAVTGHGNAVIDGGILEFRSASDAHVSFSGNTADLLKLDDVWHFTGTVTGFSFGDTIDLAGVSWWNVRLVDRGNYVEVHYGWGANDFFKIDGDYATNHFLVTTDLHGGTAITWLDQAPQIATDDLQISQSGVTTTISGLSMFDTDAGRRETFSFDVTANGHTLDHGTGRLSNINDELDHGFTYTETSPSATSTGKVAVTVTDSFGASDTVNFIFSTSTAPTTTPIALTGTAGKDVIIASSHDDTLTGGASADQFVFKTPSGHDVITDFTAGQDKIELDFVPAGSHAFQQWLASAATQQGADTLIRFDNADSLLLKHVSVSDLHASDFILHAGVA